MSNKIVMIFLISLILSTTCKAQNFIVLTFDDFNDQDFFNHFSGDWNKWENQKYNPATSFNVSFDTRNQRGDHGASMKLNYSVPRGGYGGIWNSLIGKNENRYNYLCLDFKDLYADLKNSSGNPQDIEKVQITQFSFWAKGNGEGNYNHTVKVELKDYHNEVTNKVFIIPNQSDWERYDFKVNDMTNVDLTKMRELNFVISDNTNDYRTSYLYFDDLSFTTTEPIYDAGTLNDDQFLDLISHRAFHYFLRFVDQHGFALDRSTFTDQVSVGAIGFQLAAYCIGHHRNWADNLEPKIEMILTKLSNLPMGPEADTSKAGYKGFYYHFLESASGLRKDTKTELSLYDTMLLMFGVLACKAYFPSNTIIQSKAQSLYDAVQWNWMVDLKPCPNQNQFYVSWKPESGFESHVDGYTDEALLVDILALGANQYPIIMDSYNARSRIMGSYPLETGNSIVTAWTGSLFNYFFGSCWIDMKQWGIDRHSSNPINIWDNNRKAILANRQFCIDHQDTNSADGDDHFTTYGVNSWGLTACDNLVDPSTNKLSQYYAFGALPTQQNVQYPKTNSPHVGTIAIYGAGSSILFLPEESISALKFFYSKEGLWSPIFGFADAFSDDPHTYVLNNDTNEPILDVNGNLLVIPASWIDGTWINPMMMGINLGPMLLAIENHRSGLIWNLINSMPEIQKALKLIFRNPLEEAIIILKMLAGIESDKNDDLLGLYGDEIIGLEEAIHSLQISGKVR